MILELQLEDEVLVDGVLVGGLRDGVAEEGQARQGKVVLVRLVEEETEVGEYDPELLPAVAVLEFAQQETAQLILKKKNRGARFWYLLYFFIFFYSLRAILTDARAIISNNIWRILDKLKKFFPRKSICPEILYNSRIRFHSTKIRLWIMRIIDTVYRRITQSNLQNNVYSLFDSNISGLVKLLFVYLSTYYRRKIMLKHAIIYINLFRLRSAYMKYFFCTSAKFINKYSKTNIGAEISKNRVEKMF